MQHTISIQPNEKQDMEYLEWSLQDISLVVTKSHEAYSVFLFPWITRYDRIMELEPSPAQRHWPGQGDRHPVSWGQAGEGTTVHRCQGPRPVPCARRLCGV